VLKQIGIRLDEEIIIKAKKTALDKGFTFQKLVEEALTTYIDNKITTSQDNNITIKQDSLITTQQSNKLEGYQDNKLETIIDDTKGTSPALLGDDYYLLRKTHKTKTELGARQYSLGPVTWLILDGSKSHFDINGEPIPFRFTDENGKVWEPDEEELRELSNHLGKPVKIEK
jgi:hypothetical protein